MRTRSNFWIFNRPQRSCGKVMFSQASVILFTAGGGICQGEPRTETPQTETPSTETPRQRPLPPDRDPSPQDRDPLPPQTETPSPKTETPSPQTETPRTDPPWTETNPPSPFYGNEQAVRILLECILVAKCNVVSAECGSGLGAVADPEQMRIQDLVKCGGAASEDKSCFGFLMLTYEFSHILGTLLLSFLTST